MNKDNKEYLDRMKKAFKCKIESQKDDSVIITTYDDATEYLVNLNLSKKAKHSKKIFESSRIYKKQYWL